MRRFAQLFAGRTDAYGEYTEGPKRSDGKKKGVGKTIVGLVNEERFSKHLSGEKRLGLIPIRRDGTVSWFAGDIDDYDIDHQRIVKEIIRLELPLILCKSKSNGAHIFCFVNGTIESADAIALMKKWVKQLGYKSCEVFPKQTKIEGDAIGNWIHIPYFNSANPDSFAFGLSGEKLSFAEFEQYANAVSPTPEELQELLRKKPGNTGDDKNPLAQAPPCIETMFKEGIGDGSRNKSLLHIGIYYLKSDPDNWREKVAETNYKVFSPPLGMDEVSNVSRNIAKAKYEYLCREEPMCSLCDKELCKTRKWGVGPQQGINYAEIDIDRIIKIKSDPPIYYVIIEGETIKMTTEEVLSGAKFRKRIFEISGKMIAMVKPAQHDLRIQMARIDEEEAPDEVSDDGQILEMFHDWCETHIPNSPTVEQVLRGNPYYNKDIKTIVFRATDFMNAFKRQKKFNVADRDVWGALRSAGCIRENIRIEKKQVKVWSFPVEEPWFDIPGEENF